MSAMKLRSNIAGIPILAKGFVSAASIKERQDSFCRFFGQTGVRGFDCGIEVDSVVYAGMTLALLLWLPPVMQEVFVHLNV